MSLDNFFDYMDKFNKKQLVTREDSFVHTTWLNKLEIDEQYIGLVKKYYPEYVIDIQKEKVWVRR